MGEAARCSEHTAEISSKCVLVAPKAPKLRSKRDLCSPVLLTFSCTGALASRSVLGTSLLAAGLALVAAEPPVGEVQRGGSASGASAAGFGPEKGSWALTETAGRASGGKEAAPGFGAAGGAEALGEAEEVQVKAEAAQKSRGGRGWMWG